MDNQNGLKEKLDKYILNYVKNYYISKDNILAIKKRRRYIGKILRRFCKTHICKYNELTKIKKERVIEKLKTYIEHRIPIILLKNRVLAQLYFKHHGVNNDKLLYFDNITDVLNKIISHMPVFIKYDIRFKNLYNDTYIDKICDIKQYKFSPHKPINDIILEYLDINWCNEITTYYRSKLFDKNIGIFWGNGHEFIPKIISSYLKLRISLMSFKYHIMGSCKYPRPYYYYLTNWCDPEVL
jgi:hypothetical protein